MKKLISIIAPMYNEETLAHEYCKETLAMTETLKDKYDFEIVLVNDGSKDNTYAIMLLHIQMKLLQFVCPETLVWKVQ